MLSFFFASVIGGEGGASLVIQPWKGKKKNTQGSVCVLAPNVSSDYPEITLHLPLGPAPASLTLPPPHPHSALHLLGI